MPVDAIVRVSFQSNVQANQAANAALVGHQSQSTGTGPFQRVGTAAYSCAGGDDQSVAQAIAQLGGVLSSHHDAVDFVSISYVKVVGD